MASLGNATLKTTVDGSGLTAGLTKAASEIKGFANKAKDTLGQIGGGLFSKIGLGLGTAIGAGIGFFTSAVNDAMKSIGDKVKEGKHANTLGINSEDYMGLRIQAEKFGVEQGGLDKALLKVARSSLDAANGNKQLDDTFKLLGLDAKELANMNAYEQFIRVASGVKELGHVGQQAHVASQLLGKQFADLLPLLGKGGDGIKEFNKRLADMGVTIKQGDMNRLMEQQKMIKESKEQWTRSVESLKTSAVLALAPIVAKWAEFTAKIFEGGGVLKMFGEILKEISLWAEVGFRAMADSTTEVLDEIKVLTKETLGWGDDVVTVGDVCGKVFEKVAQVINWVTDAIRLARVEVGNFAGDAFKAAAALQGSAGGADADLHAGFAEGEALHAAAREQLEKIGKPLLDFDKFHQMVKKTREEHAKAAAAKPQKVLDFGGTDKEAKFVPNSALLAGSQELASAMAKFEAGHDKDEMAKRQLDLIQKTNDLLGEILKASGVKDLIKLAPL